MKSLYPNHHNPGCPWYEIAERFGAPNLKYCEQTVCGLVSEPVNTLSNISYILCAGILLYLAKKNANPYYKSYAFVMVFMGLCSAAYHATNVFPFQLLDFFGMYVFLVFVWISRLALFIKISKPVLLWSVIVTILTIYTYLEYISMGSMRHIVFIVSMVIFLYEIFYVFFYKFPQKIIYMVLGISIVGLGNLFTLLDLSRSLCYPTSLLVQGHSIWHMLSAIGLTLCCVRWAEQPKSSPVSSK